MHVNDIQRQNSEEWKRERIGWLNNIEVQGRKLEKNEKAKDRNSGDLCCFPFRSNNAFAKKKRKDG